MMITPALLGKTLYWICPLLLLALAATLVRAGKRRPPSNPAWAPWCAGVLTATLLACFVAYTLPARQRVFWDEPVIYSTSLAMHFGQTAHLPSMSVPTPRGPFPVQFAVDKRPPLLPFLGSALHGLLGPSESNIFRVNWLVLVALLAAVFLAVFKRSGWAPALAAQLFVLSSPILLWVARSGALDILGCAATVAFLYAVAKFWEKPGQREFLQIFALGLAASYTRYEVVGMVIPSLFLCLARAWKAGKLRKASELSLTLAAASIFCLAVGPLVAQLTILGSGFVEAKGSSMVSLVYMRKNLPELLGSFFVPGFGHPFNGFACLLGLAAFLMALAKRWHGTFTLALAAGSAFQLVLMLCYFAGSPVETLSARLYLLPALALSLAPLLLARHKVLGKALLPVAALLFVGAQWKMQKELVFPDSLESQVAERVDRFFQESSAFSPAHLLVWNVSFYAVSRGLAAISPASFLELERALREGKARGDFREIYWLRTPADDPLELSPGAAAELELRFRWQEQEKLSDFPSIRLLRLTDF